MMLCDEIFDYWKMLGAHKLCHVCPAINDTKPVHLPYITAFWPSLYIGPAFFTAFIFTKQPSLEQPLNFWQAQRSGKSRKFNLYDYELHLEASPQ